MDKILTKKIQTQLSDYFSADMEMTKPESRCLRDMVLGVLKSKTVFVNQIAASLREPLKLKDVCKRLSSQYLKVDYAEKVRNSHLSSVNASVLKDDFIVMDGTDISKKYAKYMEGLEFVRNGDTGQVGLGYNVLNINTINIHNEITPLYSKAYSYQMGALSSNNEIKKAVLDVQQHIKDKGCWVFDRGADSTILKDFFFSECSQAIIRLKKDTKLFYKQQEYHTNQLVKKIHFSITQTVVKIKKDKPVLVDYELGAVPISYSIRAFKGYGLRWKIEEYHRHIKQEYKLEDIQMKTFDGLQAMLATLTIAMFMIYKKMKALHFNLLLDAGYNYLNKHTIRELTNFIYYKISKVVSILLMPTKMRWKINSSPPVDNSRQLNLMFN